MSHMPQVVITKITFNPTMEVLFKSFTGETHSAAIASGRLGLIFKLRIG